MNFPVIIKRKGIYVYNGEDPPTKWDGKTGVDFVPVTPKMIKKFKKILWKMYQKD